MYDFSSLFGVASHYGRNDMDRWEYLSIRVAGDEDPIPRLNSLGQEGWELVTNIGVRVDERHAGHTLLLKRPLEIAPQPLPDLKSEEERWLRNSSTAQALLVLPDEKRDELLCAVLTEEERECPSPPDDFYERVQRYLAARETL